MLGGFATTARLCLRVRWSRQGVEPCGGRRDRSHGGIDFDAIGATNNEIPIMEEIIGTLDKIAAVPTLVLFFTDGGFDARARITALMRTASAFPACWQFIGIGKSSFGVLEKLDTLTGRLVDNTGFFTVENTDKRRDAEVYELLLSEYPDWLRAARHARR